MAKTSQSDKTPATTVDASAPIADVDNVNTADDPLWREYCEAVNTKRTTWLTDGSAVLPEPPPPLWPNGKGNEIIRVLLRQNVIQARAILFKDYFNFREVSMLADQGQLQLHIDQYSRPAILNENDEANDTQHKLHELTMNLSMDQKPQQCII
jgi:hypothetical protein